MKKTNIILKKKKKIIIYYRKNKNEIFLYFKRFILINFLGKLCLIF